MHSLPGICWGQQKRLALFCAIRGEILRGQSSVLARRLIQAGYPKPGPWYAAHHIVPGNETENADAVQARAIFDQFMLDPNRSYSHLDDPINDAVNGVWLPQRRGLGTEAYHPEIHTDLGVKVGKI
ncbi:AHH domain-containing protein [Polycladomyces sp. WAk]|uniref:AHH domain-containing protein n=1 Tax=Polycladomyces zharkentensis TaxID=2807616 RepID=A0ABS2WGL2_9BACL|nr:AHH domain-containing protein [Polycladomyces sp. WAk]MBN2908698.1 AHH domain-containing protein [Polycladomyces sp. WAk]